MFYFKTLDVFSSSNSQFLNVSFCDDTRVLNLSVARGFGKFDLVLPIYIARANLFLVLETFVFDRQLLAKPGALDFRLCLFGRNLDLLLSFDASIFDDFAGFDPGRLNFLHGKQAAVLDLTIRLCLENGEAMARLDLRFANLVLAKDALPLDLLPDLDAFVFEFGV